MALTKVVGGVIADSTITSTDILDSTITNAKMALSPANASNLSSGSVPAAQLTLAPDPDLSSQSDDIALLAFKTQANGNLARYNLVDQSVDSFEDATGVDAGTSTNEYRDSSGKYYSGQESLAGQTNGYTASGTHTGFRTGTAEVLVVGGGGAGGGGQGGNYNGGAGGAGGLVYHATYSMVKDVVYDFTIGTGSNGTGSGVAPNGGSSVWNVNNEGSQSAMTANGGGGGGGNSGAANTGTIGSGGGAGNDSATNRAGGQADSAGGTGFSNQGGSGATYGGGGGGGAGAAGANATTGIGGNGGIGKEYTSFNAYGTTSANVASSGSDGGYFAGGGGAGGNAVPNAVGGAGGGGNGQTNGGQGTNGLANTGGGGGSSYQEQGMDGGNGFVGVSYPVVNNYNNMILVSTATTAEAAPTKGDLVFTYTNGAGTAVVGTNITAEYSADNGSTWTDFAIAAGDVQGTTGGHTIVTKNDVSLTSTSGTSMRYRIKTLVQSASINTRIHAVSLGWS